MQLIRKARKSTDREENIDLVHECKPCLSVLQIKLLEISIFFYISNSNMLQLNSKRILTFLEQIFRWFIKV